MFGVVIFDEGLLAHLVDFFEGLYLFLQFKNSIFQHLYIEFILALLPYFTNQIHTNFGPIFLLYFSGSLMTLALIILFNILGIVMLGPFKNLGLVESSSGWDF